MHVKLFRDGANRICLGPLLHKQSRTWYFDLCTWSSFPKLGCFTSLPALDVKDQSPKFKARLTRVPSPLSGSHYSSARTFAAVLSSLPKLLLSASPELPRTGRHVRSNRANSERRDDAGETSVLIACPAARAV